ncbi:MAG: exo-alpha-sialidase [Proteobacteria bacterium]|nr:exo-alpha-sialidase [Pseudomonadota bacterium]
MKSEHDYYEPNGLKHSAVDTSMETTDNSAGGLRQGLWQLLAIFLLAGNLGLAEEMPLDPSQPDAQPPFDIAPGLFDAAQPRTLGLATVPGIHTIVYRAAEDTPKFCHHPNLVIFRDRLFCMWSNGLVDEDAPGQRVLYSSSDDGVRWTTPQVLNLDPEGTKICVASGFHVADPHLVAYYTMTGGENFHPETCLMVRTSTDGQVWSSPQRIASGFFIEGPHQLPGGRLVLAGEYVGEARVTQRMRFLYSDAMNRSSAWHPADIEPPELHRFGYTEPSLYLRADGVLVATLRSQQGFLHACTSEDRGQTWAAAQQTEFPDSTARTAAGNFPGGGVYLINNPLTTPFDRSLLTIALSRDGRLFHRAFLVRGEPTKRRFDGKYKLDGWQYPHACVWKDALFIAYSINKEDLGVTRISLDDLPL